MSELYNEQIPKHDPIHSDAYKWGEANGDLPPFIEALLNGAMEDDKIYFIEDLTGESDFFNRLLEEVNDRITRLEELVENSGVNNQDIPVVDPPEIIEGDDETEGSGTIDNPEVVEGDDDSLNGQDPPSTDPEIPEIVEGE